MFTTIRNAWKISELRKKILFTILILAIYRVGSAVLVPFINHDLVQAGFAGQYGNTILGFYNTLSGSALSQASILALSIQPYINASIIIQLLTIAIPALERMAKEDGEVGKKKLERITRYTTVGLGLLMGWAYCTMLSNNNGWLDANAGWLGKIVIILSFTAGSALVMWLGEQITEFGIGNGISMILFANIIVRIPNEAASLITNLGNGTLKWWGATIALVAIVGLVLLIVYVNDAERRIPIQYAKRVVGRKIYGGQNTNLPIKVNMSGVMPVIFAQSIASLPATIFVFAGVSATGDGFWNKTHAILNSTGWLYAFLYFILIFGFAYFYAAIQYDPTEISNNLKKNGGFIPGFRPGKPTGDFIRRVINKITFFGAVFLAIVCLLPIIAGDLIPGISSLGIGGTSTIIVVGVALETVQAMEAQMMMRHYKGFLN